MTSRLHRLGDALSQLVNVAVWNGDPNHSVSGDAWRFERTRLMRSIDWVFARLPFGWAEQDHCLNSYLADVQRARNLIDEHDRHRV